MRLTGLVLIAQANGKGLRWGCNTAEIELDLSASDRTLSWFLASYWVLPGFEEADPLLRDQPLLAELCSASVRGRVAVGPGNGATA